MAIRGDGPLRFRLALRAGKGLAQPGGLGFSDGAGPAAVDQPG